MKKKILVVCHGAINRSPAAASVLRNGNLLDVRVASMKDYGTKSGRYGATKKMREAVAAFGPYDLASHRASTVTQADVDWADQIVYMDGGNLKRLIAQFPDSQSKFICLASAPLKRIPDPNFISKNDPKLKEIVEMIVTEARKFVNDHTN